MAVSEAHKAACKRWRQRNPEKVKERERNRDRTGRKNDPQQLRNWRKCVRELKNSLKEEPCKDCGCCFPPCAMDFDHRPGEKKLSTVSQLSNSSRVKMLDEIIKCDVVCANCHRVRTQRRLYGKGC